MKGRTPWEDQSVVSKKAKEARRRAQPKSIPSGEVTRTVYYGKFTVLLDLLLISTFIGSASATQNSILPEVGMTLASFGYLFAAPIIHSYYGEFGSGFKSFLFRLGAPVLGGVGGFTFGRATGDNFLVPFILGATGVVAGAAGASLIDALFLARTTRTTQKARSLAAIPSLSITPGGTFTFGLAGQF